MKLKVSELQEFLSVIEDQNLSIPEVITIIKKEKKVEKQNAEKSFDLTIDYSRTLRQMIEAGKFDWKNDEFTENNFPLPTDLCGQKVTVLAKLIHFNRYISSEEVMSKMAEIGYRPATLPELLAFGEVEPLLQKNFEIIALGSVWRSTDGEFLVPQLNANSSERLLRLYWQHSVWVPRCRFLAVCK